MENVQTIGLYCTLPQLSEKSLVCSQSVNKLEDGLGSPEWAVSGAKPDMTLTA